MASHILFLPTLCAFLSFHTPQDYKPSPYLISTVHLDFQLNEESTLVQSKLRIVPNHAESSPVSLFLNGQLACRLDVLVSGSRTLNGRILAYLRNVCKAAACSDLSYHSHVSLQAMLMLCSRASGSMGLIWRLRTMLLMHRA